MGTLSVQNYSCFSLAAFKSLSFLFNLLIIMCVGIDLLGFILFAVLSALLDLDVCFPPQMREVSKFPVPSSLPWTPKTQMLLHWMLLQRSFNLSSFLKFFFLFSLQLGCFPLLCLADGHFILLHSLICCSISCSFQFVFFSSAWFFFFFFEFFF